MTFDGRGKFDGSGVINLPGQLYGQRIFNRLRLSARTRCSATRLGTTVNGGESYFVITKSKPINGAKVATEFALVVKELQPTGNLITAIFTRLPDRGEFSVASLRGTYATTVLGEGGFQPEAGMGRSLSMGLVALRAFLRRIFRWYLLRKASLLRKHDGNLYSR